MGLSYFAPVIDVAIIGGGLSGLINAVLLKRHGLSVVLFEEKTYPFHRVCGEYISNEVIPFLKSHSLFPSELKPSTITQFQLTSPSGQSFEMPLDLGGFGISRYSYDLWLSQKAKEAGVEIIHERIISCEFANNQFELITNKQREFSSKITIGAFGKRSFLDKKLDRKFIGKRSPYIGVKYHIKTDDVPENMIALHNFQDGYCGVSKVENNVFNLCYLSHRKNLKKYSSIPEMEQHILHKNPHLARLFQNSESLFEKPEVINEVSFEKKEAVYHHILMAGDSAGMITPLCGNGMAMAIHSSKIVSELIISQYSPHGFDRNAMEEAYQKAWKNQFARRLWTGRKIQSLFGSPKISELAVTISKSIKPIASYLMKQTHGEVF